VRTLQLASKLSDEEAAGFAGRLLDDSAYDVLVSGEDADILKPDGTPLVKYRAGVISEEAALNAWAAMREAAARSENRGLAAGQVDEGRTEREIGQKTSGTRFVLKKADGTFSNTSIAVPVNSGIVGAFDRYQRTPYCRLTAFTLAHPERFSAALPFFRSASECFAREMPERYASQMAYVQRTHPEWIIHGTAFTTVTVNKNWQTATHQDAGDLKEGFGVMSVVSRGNYKGGILVFPQYRAAVDMRTGGVCLADVHEWHGNTKIVGHPGRYERLSFVLYYRERMAECGTPAEEEAIAKNRKRGQPLYEPKQ
jgi:hypothetical protein